ncbi:Multiple RNA-binding domain-containing protein 1, partial [Coemansia nantahalensis]
MSRIIVKNLPRHFTEQRFRSHFASKGEVTDVKLVYTKAGKFRRFGYIGYRTDEDAEAAQAYFNGTFIDTSRVEVEIAKPQGDASLPRAWSVYTEGTSLYNKTHEIKDVKQAAHGKPQQQQQQQRTTQTAIRTLYNELLRGKQDDPRFKEFLQIMAPRAKNRTWTNDDYSSWHTDELAAINGAVAARREQIESTAADSKTDAGEVEEEDANAEAPPAEQPASSAALSDMEWLRMHMSAKIDDGDDADGDAAAAATADKPVAEKAAPEKAAVAPPSKADQKPDPAEAVAAAIAQIEETGRLFVRNLPYMATEDDLRSAFEKFGPLSEVHMPISKDTKRPKGFA